MLFYYKYLFTGFYLQVLQRHFDAYGNASGYGEGTESGGSAGPSSGSQGLGPQRELFSTSSPPACIVNKRPLTRIHTVQGLRSAFKHPGSSSCAARPPKCQCTSWGTAWPLRWSIYFRMRLASTIFLPPSLSSSLLEASTWHLAPVVKQTPR
jgi:hypothetical protein